MWCRLVLVAAGFLAATVQAFAPIKWMKLPAKGLVLMPKGFTGRNNGLVPPQTLTVKLPEADRFTGVVGDGTPLFTVKADQTIAWDDMGWCIEASGEKSGDAVRVNRCTGQPDQKWKVIYDGHGRDKIQLKDTFVLM